MSPTAITSENKHDLHLWYVLDKINGELLKGNSGSSIITYTLTVHSVPQDNTVPHPTEEQRLISQIKELGIVADVEEPTDFIVGEPPHAAGVHYYFKVDREKFLNVHRECKGKTFFLMRDHKPLLVFSHKGDVTFHSSENIVYKTYLKPESIAYNLLKLLSQSPHQRFSYKEISEKTKEGLSERQVRDATQTIKKKLGYSEKSLFISKNGFELGCDTQFTE